jgi:hypothetical protein
MDLSGPSIEVKLKEKKRKEEPWVMGFLIQKLEYGEVLRTVTHGF